MTRRNGKDGRGATLKSEFMMSLRSMNGPFSPGFRQPTHYEGVVTCMVRVPELPQRAPMWTAASWKTNGREKGGLVNQDISLFFMDSFRPPPRLYRSQPPPDQSSCPSAAHNCMIYLLSLIHSSFSLPLFWQISTVSFKPYPALTKTSSSLSLGALVSCLFASEVQAN